MHLVNRWGRPPLRPPEFATGSKYPVYRACNRDSGSRDPGRFRQSRIPGLAASQSRDIGITKKSAKIVLFRVLNVRNKNINRLVNKIFYER